jgi:hypothetical protein
VLTLEVASRASSARRFVVAAVAGALCAACASKSDGSLRQLNRRSGGEDEVRAAAADGQRYEHAETRELVALVDDAATLIETDGEAAFDELRVPGSRWRQGETYIFVLDPTGGHAGPPRRRAGGQEPARAEGRQRQADLRRVQSGDETYVIGSGLYPP